MRCISSNVTNYGKLSGGQKSNFFLKGDKLNHKFFGRSRAVYSLCRCTDCLKELMFLHIQDVVIQYNAVDASYSLLVIDIKISIYNLRPDDKYIFVHPHLRSQKRSFGIAFGIIGLIKLVIFNHGI